MIGSSPDPRAAIGAHLHGRVLEVGPGHDPFPTAPGATVVFADKSVPGGRDATWPELVGAPHGPQADLDVDLDADGLPGLEDASFDAVVACHVVEHLADPVGAIVELLRVTRPGGRFVLVLPDRTRTFDAPRAPTTAAHVVAEHEAGVTVVDDDHVRDFCEAIWAQPAFHPEPVRSWHDPARLDADTLDLHRRRSIHAHCWSPEEAAALVTALLARGIIRVELVDHYVHEDAGPASIELGLVLEQLAPGPEPSAAELAARFVETWVDRWFERELARRLAAPAGEVAAPTVDRASALELALARDLTEAELPVAARPAALLAARALAGGTAEAVALTAAAVAQADLDRTRDELDAVLARRSYRLVSAVVSAVVGAAGGAKRRLAARSGRSGP